MDLRTKLSLLVPLWLLPVVVIGGLILVQSASDSVQSFYTDRALPFLVAYWIGLGFTNTWHLVSEAARRDKAPPGVVAGIGILSALVLLSMLGGISLLWEDPWLFGVAIAPGFAMAKPLIGRWLLPRENEALSSSSPNPERQD